MIELTESRVNHAMVALKLGLDKYLSLQAMLHDVDVSTDPLFQRRFNGFYKVRRKADWRRKYYELFKEVLAEGGSFRHVCEEIKKLTGRWEPSFSSKMVASVDPTQPVIDSVVLRNLGLKLPSVRTSERLDSICIVYDDLKKRCRTLLASDTGEFVTQRFEQLYPHVKIEPIKMLDLVLWQIRD